MKEALKEGMYLGIRCSRRNYSFKVPNQKTSATNPTIYDLWSQGEQVTTGNQPSNQNDGKSTTFSGWMPVGKSYPIGNSIRVAPDLADYAFGEDHKSAEQKVAAYKKGAASTLKRLAESGDFLTSDDVRTINRLSCTVYDVQVKLMLVSQAKITKGKEDKATGLWYREKVVRRFSLNNLLEKQQLLELITVIVSSRTPITIETGLTVKATTNGGKTSYSVESQASYSGDTDKLMSEFAQVKSLNLDENKVFDSFETVKLQREPLDKNIEDLIKPGGFPYEDGYEA